MRKRKKLWKSLRTLTVVGASGLTGCATGAPNEGYADSASSQTASQGESEGGEGEAEGGEGHGEGEAEGSEGGAEGRGAEAKGGEGEAEGSEGEAEGGEGETEGAAGEGESEGQGNSGTDLSTDDLAYLKQLALMRGHLHVGYELYKAGHIDSAKTHMKHPKSELYADVAPAFSARGTGGFAKELQALAVAVETDKGRATVDQAYAALKAAIAKNEAAVHAKNAAASDRLKLAASLVRIAAEEYAVAVVDGKMQNAHEYQDALGFTTIARSMVSALDDAVPAKAKAVALLDDLLATMWPNLIPPATLKTGADKLFGTAARLDLLAASQ